MIGRICGGICVVSFIFGVLTGNMQQMGNAVIEGAGKAVELTLSLLGTMCLWNGIMRVALAGGVVDKISKLLGPILRLLYSDAYKKGNGMGEIAASMSANIFGIGNAATPLAINAMKKLSENNGNSDTASDDMIMFTVLGTASLDIFPTTLISLAKTSGSNNPFEIIVPIWVCSSITAIVAVIITKTYCTIKKKERKVEEIPYI